MMRKVRRYRMTISSGWYDFETGKPVEYEMYYTIARRGEIRIIRKHLRKRGLTYYQQNIYRWTKRWPPKRRIRISFEREARATNSERIIHIDVIRMERENSRWKAHRLPSRTLTYSKKRLKK